MDVSFSSFSCGLSLEIHLLISAWSGGGVYLLWKNRNKLSSVDLFYGIFSFMIIFSSGRTGSAERYTYAIAPLSLALGIVLDRYPRWGYALTIFFGFLLSLYSIRFAQDLWVA